MLTIINKLIEITLLNVLTSNFMSYLVLCHELVPWITGWHSRLPSDENVKDLIIEKLLTYILYVYVYSP